MADAPYVDMGVLMSKSQCISKQKIFWIQKILLEESVGMYEILRVLDMTGSYLLERYSCTYYIA
jgi:hypothetical protein